MDKRLLFLLVPWIGGCGAPSDGPIDSLRAETGGEAGRLGANVPPRHRPGRRGWGHGPASSTGTGGDGPGEGVCGQVSADLVDPAAPWYGAIPVPFPGDVYDGLELPIRSPTGWVKDAFAMEVCPGGRLVFEARFSEELQRLHGHAFLWGDACERTNGGGRVCTPVTATSVDTSSGETWTVANPTDGWQVFWGKVAGRAYPGERPACAPYEVEVTVDGCGGDGTTGGDGDGGSTGGDVCGPDAFEPMGNGIFDPVPISSGTLVSDVTLAGGDESLGMAEDIDAYGLALCAGGTVTATFEPELDPVPDATVGIGGLIMAQYESVGGTMESVPVGDSIWPAPQGQLSLVNGSVLPGTGIVYAVSEAIDQCIPYTLDLAAGDCPPEQPCADAAGSNLTRAEAYALDPAGQLLAGLQGIQGVPDWFRLELCAAGVATFRVGGTDGTEIATELRVFAGADPLLRESAQGAPIERTVENPGEEPLVLFSTVRVGDPVGVPYGTCQPYDLQVEVGCGGSGGTTGGDAGGSSGSSDGGESTTGDPGGGDPPGDDGEGGGEGSSTSGGEEPPPA